MNPPRFEFGSPPMDITGGTEDLLDVGLARRLCEHSPLGIFLADNEGRCVYSNAACQKILGSTFGRALGKPWSDFVLPEDRQRALTEWRKAMREGRQFHSDVRIQMPDASRGWARLHGSTVSGGSKPSAYLLMVEEITEQKAAERIVREAEQSLFEEKERAQVTLDSIGDAVLATDLAGIVTYMNLEAENLTAWARDEAVGRPLAEVFHIVDGETLEVARNPALRAIEEDRTVELELGCLLLRRDRSGVAIENSAAPIHDRDGNVAGAVIVFHDAAQSRALARQNAHLAWHDQLTGLPNIALLTDRLTQAIGLAYRNCTRIALLFIDLDRFKPVNDTHGHLVGDELLKSVATRLENCVRATDTVCRRSGDEFVILLSEIARQQDAGRLAEKIFAALSAPHDLNGITVEIAVSIGISVYPDDGEDANTLMECADAAMYKAKATDLHTYCFAGADHHPRPAVGWRAGGVPRVHGVERQTSVIPSFLRLEKSS
jgi:diguanylate cyclase (GGDEF)-like protein/PAS domain S-box-containing protein